MAEIILLNVNIEFPVFNSRSRGLLNTLFRYAQREQNRLEASGLGQLNVHALRDINLTIRDGDRIGLIGRNGAGKTTLLRVLSGVYEPTSGNIHIKGKTSSLTDIMLGMDMDASGYDNIIMRGIIMGQTRQQAIKLIPKIEEFTELGQYLQLPVRAYSQGMLLRLAFAISTTATANILLMDEMIGAGDAYFVKKAQARMSSLINDVSILVLASHNESILKDFCSKGVLIDEGCIQFYGSLEECLERHKRNINARIQQEESQSQFGS